MDDFDDGDLTKNPTWIGNIDHFMTDAEGVLRLNSPLTGKSFIYTSYTAPDSLRLSLQLGLEFSPSASNLLRVYIFIDNPDITKANGYYLNFGENGSDDAIRLYKLINLQHYWVLEN
ncbi:MAG TPA: hypothetical protein PKD85_09530 [Saprospiraceae bacterium]|nr:hypothetical protein [Saprospiraceae bacterium]